MGARWNDSHWRSSLSQLADAAAKGEGAVVDLLRRLRALIDAGPDQLIDVLGLETSLDHFERQLDCAAYESAVISLCGSKTGVMLSRAPIAGAVATIVLQGPLEEFSSASQNLTTATISALAEALAHCPIVSVE